MVKKSNGSLIAQWLLNNKKCEFTIDTGATRSIVMFDLISNPPIERLRQILILETANSEQIVVHGETVVQISIGSFKHETKVLVSDVVDKFILGLLFLLDKIRKLKE